MLSQLAASFLALSVATLINPVSAVWPAPQSFSKGSSFLYLHQNLKVTYNGKFLPYTYGYSAGDSLDSRALVQAAVSRTLDNIFSADFVPWKLHRRDDLASFEPDLHKGQRWVENLEIVQTRPDQKGTYKPLDGDVDESYNLTVSAAGRARLTAASYVGVIRGLDTFGQLFFKHSAGPFWYTPYAPVAVSDAPKFPHRGVMLDVARNFFPVADIKRTIDAMSWTKLNRLHIHATDSQSWPLDIPALPELARKGAYRPDLVYSAADVRAIQLYGLQRGVEVYLEIDMPGHIGSVALSHPELITAYDAYPYWWWCAEPPCGAFKLNDTAVDGFLETVFDDLLPRLAPYSAYFHTGGDELNANDSMLDPGVRSNSTEVLRPLLQKFVDAQHARVRKAGLTPMVWEEIPIDWSVHIGSDVVVQSWLGGDSVQNLTAGGHKVIDSNYNFWYLDCGRGAWILFDNGAAAEQFYPYNDWCGPTKSWALVYSHDPVANLTAEQAKLVLGGEVAVWSETIDPVTLDSIVWPRAAAAAEALWTGKAQSQLEAAPRLQELRERFVALGVGAAPITMTFCTQGNATECSYPV